MRCATDERSEGRLEPEVDADWCVGVEILDSQLGADKDVPMETQTFTPSLVYRDPKAATEWLRDAFGFTLTMAIDGPDGDPDKGHYEMSSEGSGRVMIGGKWDENWRSPLDIDLAITQTVHVSITGDVDAHCAHAEAHGARVVTRPTDQFYGDRTYRVLDPEGHLWSFSQNVRTVTRAEAQAAIGQDIFAPDWP